MQEEIPLVLIHSKKVFSHPISRFENILMYHENSKYCPALGDCNRCHWAVRDAIGKQIAHSHTPMYVRSVNSRAV